MRIGGGALALGVMLVLGAGACGSNSPLPPDDGTTPPPEANGNGNSGDTVGAGDGSDGSGNTGNATPPGGPPPAGCQQIQVKLRGVRPGLVSEFTVRLGALRAAGGALTVPGGGHRSANLAATEDGFLLGTLSPSAGGAVSASFDVASAHVTGNAFSGEVQGCAQIQVSFAPALVKPGCEVTVELDLGRSVQRDPVTGEHFLLPQHTIRF